MSLTTLGTAPERTHFHACANCACIPPAGPIPTFSTRRMRAARKASNMTFETLAEKLGRNIRTVRRYESGQVLPPADVIGALSVALRVAVADLFE